MKSTHIHASTASIAAFKLVLFGVSFLLATQNRSTILTQSTERTVSKASQQIALDSSSATLYSSNDVSTGASHHASKAISERSARLGPRSTSDLPSKTVQLPQHRSIKLSDDGDAASEGKKDASADSEVQLKPLSWDKSWWSPGAWILWSLSCVAPTILIFILNGLTQVPF